MIDPVGERRPPISPQLAWRVALLGGIALALFAIIFFRLWYLQVLSGDQYLAEANDNQVRQERIQAPRGDIVDRNGETIVTNRRAIVVEISPAGVKKTNAKGESIVPVTLIALLTPAPGALCRCAAADIMRSVFSFAARQA